MVFWEQVACQYLTPDQSPDDRPNWAGRKRELTMRKSETARP